MLRGPHFGDEDLLSLAGGQSLTRLDMSGSRVTIRGLCGLRTLPNIYALALADTKISDAGLHKAAALDLEWLDLSNTDVGDGGLIPAIDGKPLHSLRIAGTCVDPAALPVISRLEHLAELHAPGRIITRDAIGDFLRREIFTNIEFSGPTVTDAALLLLADAAPAPQRSQLHIRDAPLVTPETVAHFHRSSANVTLHFVGCPQSPLSSCL